MRPSDWFDTKGWRASLVAGTDLVAQIHRLMRRDTSRLNVTDTEGRVLLTLLTNTTATDRQVGNRIAMGPGQLSRCVARLIGRQLIEVAPNDADRRQRLLRLSASGQDLASEYLKVREEAFDEAVNTLPPEARSAVRQMVVAPGPARTWEGLIETRPATVSDALAAFHLFMSRRASRANDHRFPSFAANLLSVLFDRWPEESELAGYVTIHDDKVVAFCLSVRGSTVDEKTSDDGEVMFVGPYVEPAYRGRKLGQQLLDYCLMVATKHTYSNASIFVPADSRTLTQMLSWNGFVRSNQVDPVMFDQGQSAWNWMSKSLRARQWNSAAGRFES